MILTRFEDVLGSILGRFKGDLEGYTRKIIRPELEYLGVLQAAHSRSGRRGWTPAYVRSSRSEARARSARPMRGARLADARGLGRLCASRIPRMRAAIAAHGCGIRGALSVSVWGARAALAAHWCGAPWVSAGSGWLGGNVDAARA